MKDYGDEQLVLMAQQGNEEAFTELYERYRKRLEFVAYRLCNNQEDAKDAVQQTYLQVHTSLYTLREPSRFYHWCCKIIHGKCTDMFRKNRDAYLDVEHSAFVATLAEDRTDFLPQKNFHFQSDREVLLSMIGQLPFPQRQVILLVYFESMSMKECAAFLNISEGTIKSRLFNAKKALKAMIQTYNETSDTPLNFQESTLPLLLAGAFYNHLSSDHKPAAKAKGKNSGIQMSRGLLCIGGCVLTLVMIGAALKHTPRQNEDGTTAILQEDAPLIFQDKEIHDSKDAYFALRNWAVDERQMKDRSDAEKAEAKKLYDYLKKNNDAYYEVLIQDGWSTAFEKLNK